MLAKLFLCTILCIRFSISPFNASAAKTLLYCALKFYAGLKGIQCLTLAEQQTYTELQMDKRHIVEHTKHCGTVQQKTTTQHSQLLNKRTLFVMLVEVGEIGIAE